MNDDSSGKVVGIIPARYGSTRFPGKSLAQIAGKSLIQRTYENAKRSPLISELIIATDDERIASHAKTFGARVVMTSSDHPTGSDRLCEVTQSQHDLRDIDIVINIQGDEPLLEREVIEKVVLALKEDPHSVMATAVIPLESEELAHDPSVVKCVIDKNQHALYFSRAFIPYGHKGSFQEHHCYYHHLGIYAYRREFLLHYTEMEATPLQLAESLEQLKVLEHGFKIKVAVVNSQCIGVDTPEDIKKVEEILCQRNSSS